MKNLKEKLKNKKDINPVDLLAGATMILAGIMILAGKINLGIILVLVGLLIEYIKKYCSTYKN